MFYNVLHGTTDAVRKSVLTARFNYCFPVLRGLGAAVCLRVMYTCESRVSKSVFSVGLVDDLLHTICNLFRFSGFTRRLWSTIRIRYAYRGNLNLEFYLAIVICLFERTRGFSMVNLYKDHAYTAWSAVRYCPPVVRSLLNRYRSGFQCSHRYVNE